VAGDFHANHFRYPGADHVTHGRAPEVVKEQAGAVSGQGNFVPSPAKVGYRF
jgi:hypothetical protein